MGIFILLLRAIKTLTSVCKIMGSTSPTSMEITMQILSVPTTIWTSRTWHMSMKAWNRLIHSLNGNPGVDPPGKRLRPSEIQSKPNVVQPPRKKKKTNEEAGGKQTKASSKGKVDDMVIVSQEDSTASREKMTRAVPPFRNSDTEIEAARQEAAKNRTKQNLKQWLHGLGKEGQWALGYWLEKITERLDAPMIFKKKISIS